MHAAVRVQLYCSQESFIINFHFTALCCNIVIFVSVRINTGHVLVLFSSTTPNDCSIVPITAKAMAALLYHYGQDYIPSDAVLFYAQKLTSAELWGAGMVICLQRGADLHMTQLMPLPLTVFCFSKIQIGFTFPVPAYLGSPGKRAVKRVYACNYVCMQLTPVRL